MTTQDLHAFAAICTADAVKEAEVIVLYHLGWDTTAFPPISFVRTALQLVPNAAVSTTVGGIAEVLADLVMLGESGLGGHVKWAAGFCECEEADGSPFPSPQTTSSQPRSAPRPWGWHASLLRLACVDLTVQRLQTDLFATVSRWK